MQQLQRIRQLLHLARMRGLRRSVRAGLQAYVFARRSWYITYRTLPSEPPPLGGDFACSIATLADVDALAAAFAPARKRREFREWIEEGSLILVAWHEGRPVAFQRASFHVPAGAPLDRIVLGPGQFWGADAQTLPAYRRRHASTSIRDFRDHVLPARGYRESIGSVQSDNLPALRFAWSAVQKGMMRIERIDYLCVLGFRRVRRVKDALPALERVLAEAGLLAAAARDEAAATARARISA